MKTFREGVDQLANSRPINEGILDMLKIIGQIVNLLQQLKGVGQTVSAAPSIGSILTGAEAAERIFANLHSELRNLQK